MRKNMATKILLALYMAVSLLLFSGTLTYAETLDVVRQAIRAQGRHWKAGETENSRVPAYRHGRRAGLVKPKLTGTEKMAAISAPKTGLAAAFDWSTGGVLGNAQNYVTPPRDQGDCGSCWAFATTGALESYTLIQGGDSTCALGACDLSEQMLLTCSRAGNCANGGYIDKASDYIQRTGLPSENCYPYDPASAACSPGSGWTSQVHKINAWAYVATTNPTVESIKNALNTTGPLATTMDVYDDFYSYYTNGVYAYTTGPYVGSHAVLIVGYEDDAAMPGGGYFRVKNSWGTDWGEAGFFRIAYSEINSKVDFGEWTIAYQTDASSGLPAAPNNLTANAVSPNQMILAWTDNSSDEDGFKIERCTGRGCTRFSQIDTAGENASQYVNSGLTGSTSYTYRIRSFNAAGNSGYSNTATGVTPASVSPPKAPSNLKATAASRSQINLSWTDNATDERGFLVERCTGAGCTTFAQIGTLGSNVKTYRNVSLTRGTSYTYRVRAYNANGYSGYSNSAAAKTLQ